MSSPFINKKDDYIFSADSSNHYLDASDTFIEAAGLRSAEDYWKNSFGFALEKLLATEAQPKPHASANSDRLVYQLC